MARIKGGSHEIWLLFPNWGSRYGDVNLLLELTMLAEDSGWDGWFIWDHMGGGGDSPCIDPWIYLAVVASQTKAMRLGTVITPLARHVGQADRAELWLPVDEYPETWLADIQVKVESAICPAMSRVLDIEKIAGMNVGEGSFSARILDPLCPWNEGLWRFESCDGKLLVSRTSKTDCELTIQSLTALIAGVHDSQDIPLRGWGNTDSSLQSIQRCMFPKSSPFLHENF